MTNEEDVLAQVQQIMDEAGKALGSDRPESINSEFRAVEQAMWGELGRIDNTHQMFSISVVDEPSDREQALNDVTNGKAHLVQGDGTIEGHSADTLVNLRHVADASDIYEALNDKWLSLDLARDEDTVGVLVRLGAKSSTEPDQDEDTKRDCTVTMMVMAGHLYVAVRHHDDAENPVYNTIHAEDYKGEDRLVNALLTFHVAAKMLFEENREVAEAIYKDLSRQREKETSNTNNKQQSKEDK